MPIINNKSDKSKKTWLKVKTLVITQSLLDWFKINNTPTTDQQQFAKFVNLVYFLKYYNKNTNIGKNWFTPISSTALKDTLGKHYKKWVTPLIDSGIVEIWLNKETNKPIYSTDSGLCISYRISNESIESGYITYSLKLTGREYNNKKDISLDKDKNRSLVNGKKEEKQDICGGSNLRQSNLEYIHSCLIQLGTGDEPISDKHRKYTHNDGKVTNVEGLVTDAWRDIDHGIWNCRYGPNSNRVYHIGITMPACGRSNIILKSNPNQNILNIDIQTCHPVLLLEFVTPSESMTYKKWLDADIYQAIKDTMDTTHEYTRDDIKQHWLDFVYGGKKNICHKFYKKYLPKLWKYIMSNFKGLALVMQNLEADIMITQMSTFAKENIIFYGPMHDGYITLDNDKKEMLMDKLTSLFQDRYGYRIIIKLESLNDRININGKKEGKQDICGGSKSIKVRWDGNNQFIGYYNNYVPTPVNDILRDIRLEKEKNRQEWLKRWKKSKDVWKKAGERYKQLYENK